MKFYVFIIIFEIILLSIPLLISIVVQIVTLIVPLLLSIAYLTLLERKQIAAIQGRKGPNVVGIFGLLQPLADGLKLFMKEFLIPNKSNVFLFIISPCITFATSLIMWMVLPICTTALNIELGILFILLISSLSVYGILIAGWSSNSNYALLGALRSAAQMISYEVSMGILFMPSILFISSLNFEEIINYQYYIWNILHLLPIFFLFFVSALAETNRSPFDLPEAEAELVAGYNVEYSGMGFALFFLGEYNNMISICTLITLIFLGGDFFNYSAENYLYFNSIFIQYILSIKIFFLLYLFILTRAALPRFRYDQLMQIGWKMILPYSLFFLLFYSFFIYVIFLLN